MNLADLHEFMAIERYHHVTILVPPDHYGPLVQRYGKEGSRHTIDSHPYLPPDTAVVIRTHRVEAALREATASFRMSVDPLPPLPLPWLAGLTFA